MAKLYALYAMCWGLGFSFDRKLDVLPFMHTIGIGLMIGGFAFMDFHGRGSLLHIDDDICNSKLFLAVVLVFSVLGAVFVARAHGLK